MTKILIFLTPGSIHYSPPPTQDFSLDPDIHRMHIAAHNMVRHLTAGMALITCREPLLMSISSNLKSAFTSAIRVSDYMYIYMYIIITLIIMTAALWKFN